MYEHKNTSKKIAGIGDLLDYLVLDYYSTYDTTHQVPGILEETGGWGMTKRSTRGLHLTLC